MINNETFSLVGKCGTGSDRKRANQNYQSFDEVHHERL